MAFRTRWIHDSLAKRNRVKLVVRPLESRLAPAVFTVTNTNDSGTGSLRQAVLNANANAGADTIDFAPLNFATHKTITLSSGELTATDALTIAGPMAKVTISGNDASKIFVLDAPTKRTAFHFSNLDLTDGYAVTSNEFGSGGAILGENAPDVTLINCWVHDNYARFGGPALELRNADGDQSGPALTVIDCRIFNNTINGDFPSGSKGIVGLDGHGPTVVIRRTTIRDNSSNGRGGAIYLSVPVVGDRRDGSLLVEDSLIANNTADNFSGGGLDLAGDYAPGQCIIRNTTITGNTCGILGGAIRIIDCNDSTIAIQNCTIVNNKATFDSKFGLYGIGVRVSGTNTTVAIDSTIVAHNKYDGTTLTDVEADGDVTLTYSYSLLTSAPVTYSGAVAVDGGNNRPIGEDPLIKPLADNGGPTLTHALPFGSPVVNKGSNPGGLFTDQRGAGFARSVGGGADIGAFELTVLPVDTIADEFDGDFSIGDLSLREAISIPGYPSIHFDPDVFATPQTIKLTLGEILLPPRTIVGPAAKLTIDGDNASRIFKAQTPGGSNVINLSNLTIINGNAGTGDGGAFTGSGFGTNLTLNLSNCHFSGNKAVNGGAINIGSAILLVEDCTFSNNSVSVSGAAISATFTNMKSTIRGTTVSGNTSFNGGAMNIQGETPGFSVFESCTISNNTASSSGSQGGGLILRGNANTVRNTTISGNSAANGGGVSQIIGGSVIYQNCTITNNTATGVSPSGRGGGIYATVALPLVFLESSVVSKNVGSGGGDDIWAPGTVTAKNSSIFSNAGITTFSDQGGNRPFGEDPKLFPLANNGGPTQTHALQPYSPLINNGLNPAMLANDQRGAGFPRSFDTGPDIGAFEFQQIIQPAGVALVTVNDGSAQRSRVSSLLITFTNPALLPTNPADAFQFKRQSDDATVTLAGTMVGDEVLLTFISGPVEFGSLADGRYTLTALASQIPNLDANDDGIVGDDFVMVGDLTNKLFRLFGDSNGDGLVTAADFNAFRLDYGGMGPSFFDYNGDGQVNANDFNQFRLRYGVMV